MSELEGMLSAARSALAETASRLAAAGARTELRAELVERRGLLARGPSLEPRGRVWRLGALLLASDGAAWSTGQVLVVGEPKHPNFRSSAALERNELAALAARARIPVGETLVIDAAPIDLTGEGFAAAPGPLRLAGGGLAVAWSPGADPVPLGRYLADRAGLLLDPPAGA